MPRVKFTQEHHYCYWEASTTGGLNVFSNNQTSNILNPFYCFSAFYISSSLLLTVIYLTVLTVRNDFPNMHLIICHNIQTNLKQVLEKHPLLQSVGLNRRKVNF